MKTRPTITAAEIADLINAPGVMTEQQALAALQIAVAAGGEIYSPSMTIPQMMEMLMNQHRHLVIAEELGGGVVIRHDHPGDAYGHIILYAEGAPPRNCHAAIRVRRAGCARDSSAAPTSKGNSAHQPREGFMAPTFRIFVRTAEGAEFQAFTWCRDEASGIARAWREGREFGHNVTAVWAEAV